MGRDKAFVEVDGTAMLVRVLRALAGAGCSPLVVVGGDAAGVARLADGGGPLDGIGPVGWVPDRWPGEGPLGAIITALGHTGRPTVVLATDLPAIDDATVRSLVEPSLDDIDVVVASTDRPEPLCARWSPSALPTLAERFAAGERAVHRVVEHLRTTVVAVSPSALRNVNHPHDL